METGARAAALSCASAARSWATRRNMRRGIPRCASGSQGSESTGKDAAFATPPRDARAGGVCGRLGAEPPWAPVAEDVGESVEDTWADETTVRELVDARPWSTCVAPHPASTPPHASIAPSNPIRLIATASTSDRAELRSTSDRGPELHESASANVASGRHEPGHLARKSCKPETSGLQLVPTSGRQDLNLRPPGPQPGSRDSARPIPLFHRGFVGPRGPHLRSV